MGVAWWLGGLTGGCLVGWWVDWGLVGWLEVGGLVEGLWVGLFSGLMDGGVGLVLCLRWVKAGGGLVG